MEFSPQTKVMIGAARAAGDLLVRMQSQNMPLIQKGEHDFATQADLDAQKVIVDILTTAFPDTAIVAEEQESPRITTPTFWTVDPIDNTLPYKEGFSTGWGTIIGYVELDGNKYEPKAGVIFLPAENELFVAEKGHGCFRNGKPWKIPYNTPFERAVIDIEIGPWLDQHCMDTVIKPLAANTAMIKSCETVVGVDLLRGKLGAWVFVRDPGKTKCGGIWDFVATSLAVQEAGGIACTPYGDLLHFDSIPMNGVVYAANKTIAQAALALMKNW